MYDLSMRSDQAYMYNYNSDKLQFFNNYKLYI